jgi:hypothetical protein
MWNSGRGADIDIKPTCQPIKKIKNRNTRRHGYTCQPYMCLHVSLDKIFYNLCLAHKNIFRQNVATVGTSTPDQFIWRLPIAMFLSEN